MKPLPLLYCGQWILVYLHHKRCTWSSTACKVTSVGLPAANPAMESQEHWFLSLLWSSRLCICSADNIACLTHSLSLLPDNLTSPSCGASSALLNLYYSLLLRSPSSLSITHSTIDSTYKCRYTKLSNFVIFCDTNNPTNQIWSVSKLNSLFSVTEQLYQPNMERQ